MKRSLLSGATGGSLDGELWKRLAAAQETALVAEASAAIPERAVRDGRSLTARFQLGRPRPRLRAWPLAFGGAAVALAIVFAVARKPTLRVRVGDEAREISTAQGQRSPSLVADPRNDLPLRFSDGSTVSFRAGSSGRMLRLEAAGAEMVLEHGSLQAHVIHADKTAWVLHAGPYRVRVTGTRFGLSWQSEKLDLALYEGSVIVDGGVLESGVPVTAGHRLTVGSGIVLIKPLGDPTGNRAAMAGHPSTLEASSAGTRGDSVLAFSEAQGRAGPERTGARSGVRAGELSDADRALDDDLASVDSSPDDGPATAPGSGGVRSPRAAGPRRPSQGRASHRKLAMSAGAADDDRWVMLAERGAYPEALAAAKRIGWSKLCRRLDAHRLLTLADVARYSDARGAARQAFEALVRRLPDDRLAADAVFSLGRLAFEAGRPPEASRWFRRYVADWPKGPLAEQAAGRLVETAIRMEDSEGARNAARAYLARAPHGAQAGLARGVLAEPSDGTP